ncbi:MAG: GNAT family N-acetyltransferase [Janthinobacterium lividum]
MAIQHDPASYRFTTTQAGGTGELVYEQPQAGVIDFVHTFVDESLRGQGVADELARAGLAFARAQHLKVRTSCEFMAAFAQRHHTEYADVLAA